MSTGLRWTNEQLDAWARKRKAADEFERDMAELESRQLNGGKRANWQVIPNADTPQVPPASTPPSKYGNAATDGEASKRQAKRLHELRLMNEAGQIRGLARQPEYVLIPKQVRECGELIERKTTYIADFQYEEWTKDGWKVVVEDSKGYATPGYVMKRKLMLRIHGIEIRET